MTKIEPHMLIVFSLFPYFADQKRRVPYVRENQTNVCRFWLFFISFLLSSTTQQWNSFSQSAFSSSKFCNLITFKSPPLISHKRHLVKIKKREKIIQKDEFVTTYMQYKKADKTLLISIPKWENGYSICFGWSEPKNKSQKVEKEKENCMSVTLCFS